MYHTPNTTVYLKDDLGNYQSDTVHGIGSFEGDPLFITSTPILPLDFQLSDSSPAIDAGADVSLTGDYFTNPQFDAPDVGALEYQKTQ